MDYFSIGANFGLIVYVIFIAFLTWHKGFRRYFYKDLLEYTILGNIGRYIHFPTDSEKEEHFSQLLLVSLALMGIHAGLFILWILVCLLLGGVIVALLPIIGIVGLFIYIFIYRKRKRSSESQDSKQ